MSGLIERLIARGMPPAPADREIGDYLAALRVGRTDVGEAIAHHQETRRWATRILRRAAAVYGRRTPKTTSDRDGDNA